MKRFYLDSSFLVSLLFEGHENNLKAKELLENLLNDESGCILLLGTLAVDETWYSLYEHADLETYNPFSTFADTFKEKIDMFLSRPDVRLVSPIDNMWVLNKAIEGAKKFNLRPRDAFHYAMASEYKACIVAKDRDYLKTDLNFRQF